MYGFCNKNIVSAAKDHRAVITPRKTGRERFGIERKYIIFNLTGKPLQRVHFGLSAVSRNEPEKGLAFARRLCGKNKKFTAEFCRLFYGRFDSDYREREYGTQVGNALRGDGIACDDSGVGTKRGYFFEKSEYPTSDLLLCKVTVGDEIVIGKVIIVGAGQAAPAGVKQVESADAAVEHAHERATAFGNANHINILFAAKIYMKKMRKTAKISLQCHFFMIKLLKNFIDTLKGEIEVPNIKSAKKRVLVTEKKTMRNRIVKTQVKNAMKKFLAVVESGDKAAATAMFPETCSVIDGAVSKGVLKKNTAANKKSGLAKRLNEME